MIYQYPLISKNLINLQFFLLVNLIYDSLQCFKFDQKNDVELFAAHKIYI